MFCKFEGQSQRITLLSVQIHTGIMTTQPTGISTMMTGMTGMIITIGTPTGTTLDMIQIMMETLIGGDSKYVYCR